MNVYNRYTIAIFLSIQSCGIFAAVPAHLQQLLERYQRAVTVLEIGRSSGAYLFKLAQQHSGTYILMDQKLPYAGDYLEERAFPNIVFLHPEQVDLGMIAELGKCEHFDVAIIRQNDHLVAEPISATLPIILALGDHIFVELPPYMVPAAQAFHACTVIQQTADCCLCYFEMHKTFITKARWTAQEEASSSYGIVSNFKEKYMAKRSTGTTSTWIPGINLLTFLMLRGMYPTDKMMRKELKTFKHIEHNDLVIGNIVVQGEHIVPIDFHDKRRNISPKVCVKAALKKIIGEKRLKRDIHELLQKYTRYIHNHKKKFNS